MADSLESVNAAARLYRRWLEDTKDVAESTRARWATVAEGLEAAAAELVRLRTAHKPIPADYGDLSDLPPELLAQLSGIKTDELEDQIYAIVKAGGDQIELDRLLIELYRRHGDVHQRRFLNNKCYRMAQKGLIHIVRGRKGVYSIHPQPEPESQEEAYEGGFSSEPKTSGPREDFSADLDDEIPF